MQRHVSEKGTRHVIQRLFHRFHIVPICSVSMEKPLGNVWKGRVQRYEYSHTKVYREANARREAAAKAVAEDRFRQRVLELKRLERQWGKQEIVIAAADALGALRGG